MKKFKKFVRKYVFVAVVSLVFLAGVIGVAKADAGFLLDRIIQVAGQVLGTNLTNEIKDSGALNNISEEDLVGAMPGDVLPGSSFTVGGVTKYYYHSIGNYSTTTVHSVKCPNATTTIESLTLNIWKADATANYFQMATSTTYNATTSIIDTFTASASTLYNRVYTEASGTSASECAPNTYIVVRSAVADVGSSTLNVILRKSN